MVCDDRAPSLSSVQHPNSGEPGDPLSLLIRVVDLLSSDNNLVDGPRQALQLWLEHADRFSKGKLDGCNYNGIRVIIEIYAEAALTLTNKGFTLVETMIAVALIAVLSAIGFQSFKDIGKKARATEIKTHLSTAARKLQVLDEVISEEHCLDKVGLHDSNNFFYSF